MPTIVDLERHDKDPLDLIVRHKDIVRHLRGNGIDGFEIKKILDNSYGLKKLDLYITDAATKQLFKEQHQIDYAMRHVKALVNNEAITDDERKCLFKIWDRLGKEYFPLEMGKSGWPMYKIQRRKGDAKTDKQVTGRQVVALHAFMMKFNGNKNSMPYPQTAIFDLIAELFEVRQGQKFTRDQIKNFYTNHPLNHK